MEKRTQMLNNRRREKLKQYQALPFSEEKRKELWLDIQILDLQIKKEKLKAIRSSKGNLKV